MKKLTIVQIGILMTALALMAILISTSYFYHGHWFNSTTVNGINVSNCTYEEAEKKIEDAFSNFTLRIKGRENGGASPVLIIKKEDIDFRINVEEELKGFFDKQHSSYFLFHLFGTKEYNCQVKYSEEKLNTLLKNSELVKGSASYSIQKPKNAYLKYNKEKGALEVAPEVYGNQLDIEVLTGKVANALTNLETSLDLTKQGLSEISYKIPAVKKDSEKLREKMNRYNKVVNHWITWNMGEGHYETITPDLIYKWVRFDKKNKLVVDKEKVGKWVEEFCKKYRTSGATRTFKTHSGKKIEIKGGDYGFIMDYNKTLKQVVKAIKKTQKAENVENYLATPTEENKKLLTDTLKPQYLLQGHKMDFENFSNDWDTKNYIEVSLKEQKVYIYKKGKCVFKAKCITGKPTKERSTKTGTYYIKEHMPSKVLVGDDYKTPVKFWTRIMWSGTGFHSATWQNWGKWTPKYYKTRGSHGCINLSLSDAKKVYELTKTFDAVFIY